MNVCDINPYIRYADMRLNSINSNYTCTYDNRIFYIMNGKCNLYVNDNKYSISKGSLLLFRAGTRYMFDIETDVDIIVINFDYTQINNAQDQPIAPEFEENFDRSKIIETELFEDCPELNVPLVIDNMNKLENRLTNIVRDFGVKTKFQNELISSSLKKILTYIAIHTYSTDAKTAGMVEKILEYISQNYNKDISNYEIGDHVGYHSYHVNRLMVQETGVTLRQHILNYRIEAAKELLVKSDIPVHLIAKECGFNSAEYFSNCFKKRLGISPLEYRNSFAHML